MAKEIRKPAKVLRSGVAPRIPKEDRERFRNACFASEKETIQKAKEFVKKIDEEKQWGLEDWSELYDLADFGKTLMEMRIAML